MSIFENNGTNLAGPSTAGSLDLDANGAIVDNAGATLVVTGLADFADAGGAGITLDNAASNTYGTLTFNSSGAVTIVENDGTSLVGASTAGSLDLDTAGDITDDADADLSVTGLADIMAHNAGFTAAITLGDQAGNVVNFGSLTVTSDANTMIAEDSTTNLNLATAAVLTLASSDAIVDNNAGTDNIAATSAALTAANGIGSGNALETVITNLAFSNTTAGTVEMSNTGSLTVRVVSGMATSSNTAGAVMLTATSPITFAVNTTSAGTLTAQALETAAVNTDNITVDAGVTVESTGADVVFEAGDRIIVNNTAVVHTGGGNVTFDSGSGDTDSHGSMTLDGTVSAGTRVTLDLNAQAGAVQAATGTIDASELLLLSTGANGSFWLNASTTNNVDTIAASSAGAIDLRDDNGVTVGTVGTTNGITTSDDYVIIDSSNAPGGTIVVNQPITTAGSGTGGTVSITGSVTVNATLTAAGGNIQLYGSPGGTSDLVINGIITSPTNIVLDAPRDILVRAKLQANGDDGANIGLTADSDGDGVGGVQIGNAGQLVSENTVVLSGSDLFADADAIESVQVDSNDAQNQIEATGNIAIGPGANAPADADVEIDGAIESTGAGTTISIEANEDVLFGVNGDVTRSDAGASGLVHVFADQATAGGTGGVVTMVDGTVIDGGGGEIEIFADGNISLAALETFGDIQVTTGNGSILDCGDSTVDVTGAGVSLSAVNGTLGAFGDALSLAADSLTTDTSTSGALQFLSEADSVTWNTSDAGAGTTTLASGRFDVGSGQTVTAGTVNVVTGATLGGEGTVDGVVVTSGTVAPGVFPGVLSTGSVTFADNSSFDVEIGGTTVGSGADFHDQLVVTGTVSIGENVMLTRAVFDDGTGSEFEPSPGDEFVIIDSTGGVTGTFVGLAEGATIPDFLGSGRDATITYHGGEDNLDVIVQMTGTRPVYDFSAAIFSTSESHSTNTTNGVTVKRSGETRIATSVDVVLAGDTATTGGDFTAGPVTVNFGIGETSKTVPIQILGDQTVEADESINLSFTNFSHQGQAGASQPTAKLTITNDDSAQFTIKQDESGSEDGLMLHFTIDLSHPVDSATSVTVSTTDGTAKSLDNDYTLPLRYHLVSFPAGSQSQLLAVDPTTDWKVEPNETFTVSLGTVTGGYGSVTASSTSRTGTIVNDDPPSGGVIGGRVWNDSDADGIQDAGELPIRDVHIFLYSDQAPGGQHEASTMTSSIGTYSFTNLSYGNYYVRTYSIGGPITGLTGSPKDAGSNDALDSDFDDHWGRTDWIKLAAGAGINTIDAGFYRAPSVHPCVKDPSLQLIPGWCEAYGPIPGPDPDPDPDTVWLAVSPPSAVLEDGTSSLQYTFSRTYDTRSGLVVNFSVGGTADDATDYTVSGGDVTYDTATNTGTVFMGYGVGITTNTVTVVPKADTTVEASETVVLKVMSSSGYSRGTSHTATGTIMNNDTATLTLAGVSASRNEGTGGTTTDFTFSVTLSDAVQGGFDVAYATNDGTATLADNDYVDNDGKLTFAGTAGESKTITVQVNNDAVVESHEMFQVALGAISGLASGIDAKTISTAGSPATATIADDDTAQFAIRQGEGVLEDDAATVSFTIKLSNPVDEATSVKVTTIDGTARILDGDYTGLTDSVVNFPAFCQNKTFLVDVTDDTKVEADETFTVSLSAATGGHGAVTASGSPATGTIRNDDTAQFTIKQDESGLEDAADTATFTVELSNPVDEATSVKVSTKEGTALVSDSDYTELTDHVVNFAADQQSETFLVDVTADTNIEADETFTVSLGGVSGGHGAVTASETPRTGNILDDELSRLAISDVTQEEGTGGVTAFAFPVSIHKAVSTGFGVPFTLVPGTAGASEVRLVTPSPLVFAGTAGETKMITVEVVADSDVEPDETFQITLGNPTSSEVSVRGGPGTGTIENDDTATLTLAGVATFQNEGTGGTTTDFTFSVALDKAVPGGFSVSYSTNDGTARLADNDYVDNDGRLEFRGTAGESQTITVQVNDDAVVEPDEVFEVALGSISGLGPGFDVNDVSKVGSPATGTIENDDSAKLTLSRVSASQNEGTGGTTTDFTFSVALDNAVQGGFDVAYTTNDRSAKLADNDYVDNDSNLNFAGIAGESQTITVQVNDDAVVEPDEVFEVALGSISGLGPGVDANDVSTTAGSPVTATIVNDDSAKLTVSNVTQNEGDSGTTAFTFTVTLAGDVDVPLTVGFSSSDGDAEDEKGDGDYQSATGTLHFAGTTGQQQTIPITVTADNVLEPDEEFFVDLANIDADGRNVTFADNQGRGLILQDERKRNLVSAATGGISKPGEVDEFSLEVTRGTLYSLQVWDYRDAGLDPDAVEILDAEGNQVPIIEVRRDAAAEGPSRSAVVVDLAPGIYRVFVRSQNGTTGPYRVDLRLPGAVDGERIVSQRAVQLAEVAMLQHHFGFNAIAQELFGQKLGIDLSVDQFRPEFDANLNGHIDPLDMDTIVKNYANGSAVESVATLTPIASGTGNGENGEAESDAVFRLSDSSFSVFQNPEQATDVDASGQVTPLDALLVINKLNAGGSGSLDAVIGQGNTATGEGEADAVISPPFYDVSGDFVVSPLDVLLVVNDLNGADSRDGTAGVEGESARFAWADIGRPSVAEVSRSGGRGTTKRDPETTGLFGAGKVFGAGLPTPPEPPTAALQDAPLVEPFPTADAGFGRPSVADVSRSGDHDTTRVARVPRSPDHGTTARDGYFLSQSAHSTELDSDLLDLLTEDVETVWN